MRHFIITILLVFLCIYNMAAQWIMVNPPCGGGNISAIANTNERVYVGTELGGLYYSDMNELGEYNWELMDLKTDSWINDIIQIENNIYVATRNGLYLSTNNGQDWVIEKFGYEYFSVNKFKYDNNTLYVVSNKGVAVSKNNGSAWEHIKIYEGTTEPENSHDIHSIDVRNDTIVATSIGFVNEPTKNSCIWISYDAGKNWTDMTTEDIPYKQINAEMILGDTVFIATTYGVYKSSLEQIKWYEVALDKYNYKDIQYDGKNLYVVASNGYLFYSKDEGYTWSYPAPHNIKPTDYYTDKILINNKDIILTTSVGLLKSSDKCYSWYEINDGLNAISFNDIEIKKSEMFLCSVVTGVFSSTDSGTSWFNLNSKEKDKKYLSSICRTDDALYSGAYIRGTMNVTFDNGQSWQLFSKDLPPANYMFIKEYKDYLFIGTSNHANVPINSGFGFYRAGKDGTTVDTLSYDDNNRLLIRDFTSGDVGIFAASQDYGVLFSQDDGLSWTSISDNISDNSFSSVAYSDGVLYAGSGTGKLYKTSDLGTNWDILYQTPVDTASIFNIKVKDDDIFFTSQVYGMVLTDDCGIKVIKTTGGKCVNISGNIAHRWIYDVEFLGDSILITTAKGFYKAAISDFEYVGVIDGEPLIGNYLYTYPPYPQPAKESVNTLIYWDSKLNINNAEMGVYDFLGAKVCGKEHITLSQNSSWSGIVTWDATGTPPGIYFLQIRHGTRTEAIKMLIE